MSLRSTFLIRDGFNQSAVDDSLSLTPATIASAHFVGRARLAVTIESMCRLGATVKRRVIAARRPFGRRPIDIVLRGSVVGRGAYTARKG